MTRSTCKRGVTPLTSVTACVFALAAVAACAVPSPAADAPTAAPGGEVLQQIISRENAYFIAREASMSVGRDGMVYLASAPHDHGYVLRIARDGAGKYGGEIVYAIGNVTANAGGVVASANGHFAHKVQLYDPKLAQTVAVTDFLVNDTVGWNAPTHVEAGESGDFYGLDQHRNRILRISPLGQVVRAYAMPATPTGKTDLAGDFRVCEAKEQFYAVGRGGEIRCIGFDGEVRWTEKAGAAAGAGGIYAFDVAPDGTMYVLPNRGLVVKRFLPQGQPTTGVRLQFEDGLPGAAEGWFFALRVFGEDLVIRRPHETELFQVFDVKTGQRRTAVSIDHERLTVGLPGLVWTAGQELPVNIRFDGGGQTIRPRWRLWLRAIESADYRELPPARGPQGLADGKCKVPADCQGLFVLKVTPETQPVQRGRVSEYLVRALVEVRRDGAAGSATVLTPAGRTDYARGEAIDFAVALRGRGKSDVPFTVRLLSASAVVAERKATGAAGGEPARFHLPAATTAGLACGEYRLTVEAPEMTCTPQRLRIGPGRGVDVAAGGPLAGVFRVQYGDYGTTYPAAEPWDVADVVTGHRERMARLGFDLLVDRIGQPLETVDLEWSGRAKPIIDGWAKRLTGDTEAVAPEKVRTASPLQQTVAAYSADGVDMMAILAGNDAGLPLGSGFDNRKPPAFIEGLTKVTKALGQYPAFRGWSWSSNWWVFENRGASAGKTPEEKAAYTRAVKKMKDEGAWDDVLGRVSDTRLAMAVDAQAMFNAELAKLAGPGSHWRTSVAAPYRNVESYPPVTFSNVDEVDLHIQWEQIGVPFHGPHNVDFYKRPGKIGWGHPEIWNDDGTGGQVLSVLLSMLMRGADGIGCSGPVPPPWVRKDDPRTSHFGSASVFRAMNDFTRRYGPLMRSLSGDDRVAILACPRMFKTDEWAQHAPMGRHFSRVMEAYITCLFAHRPASIVFGEDATGEGLRRYKALLVVGQRVAMDLKLGDAVKAAKAAGATVFYDDTCRKECVEGFTPLGVAFDKVENDPSAAGDDAAYWRFRDYARANLPAVVKALAGAVEPAADVANDEVLVSQRKAGKGRYVFVVNNTMPDLTPAHLWRMNLALTNRVPLVAPVGLKLAAGEAVYEVMAMKKVDAPEGRVQADLRSSPARIYAILPAAIDRVELRAASSPQAGSPAIWQVRVLDAGGSPIAASVPVRVRLLAGDGPAMEEQFAAAQAAGAAGQFLVPVNAPQGPLALEAAEMLSGRSVRMTVNRTDSKNPLQIVEGSSPAPTIAPGADVQMPRDSNPWASGTVAQKVDLDASETRFGPHVRDMVLLGANTETAVMNTMNWDHNLYAVDTATGQVRWRQRAGQYFAFSPQVLPDGVAVEGFDFNSAAGYHMYLVGADGKLQRRFALYGLPKRLPHRFVPGLTAERIDSFAAAPGGAWVASSGDLGIAVWDRAGKLLWSQDRWKTKRQAARLAALDDATLLAADGLDVAGLDPVTGKAKWQLNLAPTGELDRVALAEGGKTAALLTTFEGGRVFLLREGKCIRSIPTPGGDLALSADGTLLALTDENQLKLYSVTDGLRWTFAGDSPLRYPRLSGDGKRIAAASDDGLLYVLDMDGRVLHQRDLGARPVPRWLAGGDLLVATWMGAVRRLDAATFAEKWRTQLAPEAADMTGKLLAADGAPTAATPAWGNAEPKPAAIAPNLLAATPVLIRLVPSGGWGGEAKLSADPKPLYDGRNDAPKLPWVPWNYVGFFAETSPRNYLEIDTFNRLLRVSAVTCFEDANHPESFLRDAALEWWDPTTELWVAAGAMLSDAPVHTHKLARPAEAARFRFVLPYGLVGNLRLSEIVFHGDLLGPSHPDAAAKRPVAVLFDEQTEVGTCMGEYPQSVTIKLDGAYSGGRCLAVKADKVVRPRFVPPFGHRVPNWDFPIVENPGPGEYRYLQFAWRALSHGTKGITLQIATNNFGGLALHAGALTRCEGATPKQVAPTPPEEWQTVRVDLWKELGSKPTTVGAIGLGCQGGPAALDQVLLGRTEKDLDSVKPMGK